MPDQTLPFLNGRPLRVLIADDTPWVRRELRVLLELTGKVQVVGEAANGAQAVEQADRLHPDVVVMDLEMPVLDGYAATRRIKAAFPACRLIALTIHSGAGERQRALEAGMADVVVKGAPLEKLLQAIQADLGEERPAGNSA